MERGKTLSNFQIVLDVIPEDIEHSVQNYFVYRYNGKSS